MRNGESDEKVNRAVFSDDVCDRDGYVSDLPLIPTLQELYGVPTEMSSWMIGAYTLGASLFALIAGPLSDGWNRKKVMLFGMTAFAVSTSLCGLAADFWSMCLFRFLAGVSAAFTAPQVWVAVPALYPAPKIAKVMGIAYAGFAVSQLFGIPVGDFLAAVHWSYPFFAIGGASLLLAAAILFFLPDLKPKMEQTAQTSVLKRYVPLILSGKARAVFLAYLLIHLGSNAAFAFTGKWMTDRFHLSVDQVGYMIIFMGLGNLLGSMSGRLRHRRVQPVQHHGGGLSPAHRGLYRSAPSAVDCSRCRCLLRHFLHPRDSLPADHCDPERS
ncbi:MFS transporter [Paenibacillus sp. P25]|nr:MFS transporter [Paenibacillus sp. P25]